MINECYIKAEIELFLKHKIASIDSYFTYDSIKYDLSATIRKSCAHKETSQNLQSLKDVTRNNSTYAIQDGFNYSIKLKMINWSQDTDNYFVDVEVFFYPKYYLKQADLTYKIDSNIQG